MVAETTAYLPRKASYSTVDIQLTMMEITSSSKSLNPVDFVVVVEGNAETVGDSNLLPLTFMKAQRSWDRLYNEVEKERPVGSMKGR